MQLDEVPAAPLITMPPRQAKVGTIHEWILDILDNRLGLSAHVQHGTDLRHRAAGSCLAALDRSRLDDKPTSYHEA